LTAGNSDGTLRPEAWEWVVHYEGVSPVPLDAFEIARLVRAGEASPVEVLDQCLARIERHDGALNAFTELLVDEARVAARAAERRAGEPDPPPLLGVPVAIKDHCWVEGAPATNGSLALRDFVAPEDAAAVARLRAAGAIIVGKTNNPEFLYRGYTDNDVYGLTRNPWNLGRTPGGSSGGSGAAVAAGLTPLALGTDGGGSIRMPAAFCGVVGLKPTFGLVPGPPGFRGWPTLSVSGPLSRTTRDTALMLSCMVGMHPADAFSVPVPSADFLGAALQARDLAGLRIAYSEDFGFAPVEPSVRAAFRAAVERLADAGCELLPAAPKAGDPVDLWWRIAAAESYASERSLLAAHEDVLTEGTADIMRAGLGVSAVDYLDAQHERAAYARVWAEFLDDFDALIAPSVQVPAFPVGAGAPAEVDGRPCDPLFEDWCSMCYPVNLTGQPSLSLPMGFDADGLPLALQVITPRFDDHVALRIGAVWEQIFPWPTYWPPQAAQPESLTTAAADRAARRKA
jgi:Asp-tRNA(Asn)/Glu-tRNA(Gln) amidotransferase A subunit family amidase